MKDFVDDGDSYDSQDIEIDDKNDTLDEHRVEKKIKLS